MNLINELIIFHIRKIEYFVKYMLICLFYSKSKSAIIVEFMDACIISAQQQFTTTEQYSSTVKQ